MASLSMVFELNATIMFCSFVMCLKLLVTSIIQGGKSAKAGTRIREDAHMTKEEPTEEAKDGDIRWKKIVQNDTENVYIGLIIFWGARIVSQNGSSRLALIILMPIFVWFRIMHTIFFAFGKQSLRSVSYGIANLSVLAAGLVGVIDAFENLNLSIYTN